MVRTIDMTKDIPNDIRAPNKTSLKYLLPNFKPAHPKRDNYKAELINIKY